MSARNLTLMVALSLSFAAPGMASQIGDTPELSYDAVRAMTQGFTEAGAACTADSPHRDHHRIDGAICLAESAQCGGVRAVFERGTAGTADYRMHFQFRGTDGVWRYGPRALTLQASDEVAVLLAEGLGLTCLGTVGLVGGEMGGVVAGLELSGPAFEMTSWLQYGAIVSSIGIGSAGALTTGSEVMPWLLRPGADMYRGAAASRPWTAIGRERQACIADYLMGVSRLAQTVSTGGTPTAPDFAAVAGRSASGARAAAPATEGAPAADSASE